MPAASQSRTPVLLVASGAALLCVGSYWGLAKAPAEVYMGDVQRIASLIAVDSLVLGAMILEDAADVGQPPDEREIA